MNDSVVYFETALIEDTVCVEQMATLIRHGSWTNVNVQAMSIVVSFSKDLHQSLEHVI